MLRKKIAIERADSMLLRIKKNGILKEEKNWIRTMEIDKMTKQLERGQRDNKKSGGRKAMKTRHL